MTWEENAPLKLMVVDDEPDNLDLLYRTFRRDFEVFKAENGFSALDLLDSEGEMAVIISDQRMPRMNGTEFLSRTVDRFPDTIRIVLTGYTDVEDLVEAINSGKVFKYITKPWNPEKLKTVVFQAAETYRVVKQRTQALTRSLRRESFFNEVMTAIRESLDYRNMLQTIVTTLGKTVEADYAVLYPVNPVTGTAATEWNDAPKTFTYSAHDHGQSLQAALDDHSQGVNGAVLSHGDRQQEVLPALEVPVTALTLLLVYQQSGLATVSLYRIKSQEAWSEETLKLLDGVTEQIALALFQAGLYQRIQEQTLQMQAELEVARQIQTNLLRQSWPDSDQLSVQARCRPARQVGGDFFEVFFHPNGEVWLAVGDVSGKGVPAALFMASAISVLRRELSQEAPPSPEQVMQNLNQGLLDDLVTNNCFITMVLVRYNPTSHGLMYANAGHIYPIIWSASTANDKGAKPEYLEVRGVPLGILPVWKAKAGETTLPQGSTLLLASDGITEATIPDDRHPDAKVMLQQEGLWQLLKHQPRPLNLDNLLLAIQGEKDQQEDDQTILSLEVM